MGKVDKAIEMLDSVPKNHSEYSRALFYKSMILNNGDDSVESRDLLKKAIEVEFLKKNSSPEEVFGLALEYASHEEFEEAIKYLDFCIEKEYELVMALLFKSVFFAQLGKFEDANKCIDEALAIEDDNVHLIRSKGIYLAELDNYEESLKWFEKAIELDPDSLENLESLAITYFRMENYEKAFECADNIIDKFPEYNTGILLKIRFYHELEDYENVEKCFEIAESMDEDDTEILFGEVLFYMERSQFEKANEYIDRCLELDPQSDLFARIKLIIVKEIGDSDLLDEAIEDIYQSNPEFIESLLNGDINEGDFSDIDFDDLSNAGSFDGDFSKGGSFDGDFSKGGSFGDDLSNAGSFGDDLSNAGSFGDESWDDFSGFPSNGSLSRDSSKYKLDEYVIYGKDYPSESLNYIIYNLLTGLKSDSNIENVYSEIELGLYSEEMITDLLVEDDFIQAVDIDNINVKKEALSKNAEDLQQMLKDEGITASGKKKKLVKLAVKHVPPIKFCTNFSLMDKGEKFLNDFAWFKVYDECLLPFDLEDVSKYVHDHKEDLTDGIDGYMDLFNDYLEKHIELAHEKEDFMYLDDCLFSQSLLYKCRKDYMNCLRASLREFILRLNPIYEYEIYYAIYGVFVPIVVENIGECLEEVDVDIESLFYEIWDLKDSKEDYAPKEEGFNYLKRALDGEDLDKLSDEYEEKYIQVIYRE